MSKSLETIQEELPFWQDIHKRLREGDMSVADSPKVQDVFSHMSVTESKLFKTRCARSPMSVAPCRLI